MSLDSQISDYVVMADATRRGVTITHDKERARSLLSKVPPDKVFWLHDGRSLSGLEELRDALASMDQGLFQRHAQPGKNDFARWIIDVIGDTKLAKEMAKCRTAKSAFARVESRINELISRLH
jgi:alpha-amylase